MTLTTERFAQVLAKAVGSTYLRKRVETIRPDVHVFGHTHFGYDLEIDGIRYARPLIVVQILDFSRTFRKLKTKVFIA